MNNKSANSGIGNSRPDAPEGVRDQASEKCPVCGTTLSVTALAEGCPICLLNLALNSESRADSTIAGAMPTGDAHHSFEHYELVTDEDGKPVELGRGAMGVTYKAFDRHLGCPVALKVINERYLNDESARLRFVREARASARLRHPNVATVFHLGKKDHDYFYAMEFVTGESLELHIRRCGPFDVKMSLEIVEQVNSALGAAYREQIVHRDIKPSNLMVDLREGENPAVKVIDFGLAKTAASPQVDPSLSTPGMFFGTAHFASPEQCEGKEADIRSDIYSLGITLWEMLTAKVPFDGTRQEVMMKHLSAPLPLEQLEQIPSPIIRLLQFMLEKNPADRPQNPLELQTALRAVRTALTSCTASGAQSILDSKIPPRRPFPGLFVLLLTLSLAAICALTAYFLTPALWKSSSPRVKSIAVLPFDNLSESAENEYFGEGLTSEVIYRLSSVADLRVIARSSVLRYKSALNSPRKPLKQIGEELGVSAILESSVQRGENRIKIVSILYEPSTDTKLWAASYDREIKDVLAIEDEIAEQIVSALQAKLSGTERANLQQRPTANLSAYDLFLRARVSYQLSDRDNEIAIKSFRDAINIDPEFAAARVGLAEAYVERVKRFHGGNHLLDEAIDLCEQAIAADPAQLRGYTGLARALNAKGAFDRMEAPVKKALEIAPNDWDANRMAAAQLTDSVLNDRVYKLARKCYVTSPNEPWAPYELALASVSVGEKNLAEHWIQLAISLEPDPQLKRMMQAERLVYRGEYAAALPELRQLPPDMKTFYASASDLVLFCTMKTGNWPAAIQMLREKLRPDNSNPLTLLRLSLALRAAGRDAEAVDTANYAVRLAQQRLPSAKKTRWLLWDLSIGSRLLDRKNDAYTYLHQLLETGGFPEPVLGPRDPALDVFRSDPEFGPVRADLEEKNAQIRARILEIETAFDRSHGPGESN
jgi:serine/threonine protein kinase/Tfp pilus assembly protein PilF